MFTKTRTMCVLAGSALLAALSGAVGAPAEAAPGSALNIPWVAQTYGGLSVLPQEFQAGDCHLQGLTEAGSPSKAWIELVPANSDPPGYWVSWRYSMFSTHIFNKFPFPTGDVWHATFSFKNANGTELFHWGPVDGRTMETEQTIYTGEVRGQIYVSKEEVDGIRTVDWSGDC